MVVAFVFNAQVFAFRPADTVWKVSGAV